MESLLPNTVNSVWAVWERGREDSEEVEFQLKLQCRDQWAQFYVFYSHQSTKSLTCINLSQHYFSSGDMVREEQSIYIMSVSCCVHINLT